jgi:hypothetical protein
MNRLNRSAGLLVLALAGTALHAADDGADQQAVAPKASQAAIPFANLRSSIRHWQADGTQGLWVQDARRQWYYAELLSPCHGLDFAMRVGFRTHGSGTLDRFGSLVIPGHDSCAIRSFTRSEGPPGD